MKNFCNGCTTCCQWGHNKKIVVSILPEERAKYLVTAEDPTALQTKDNGDCIYLDRRRGCTIYDTQPSNCRAFSCVELLGRVLADDNNVYMRTLMEAVRINLIREYKMRQPS